MLVVVWLVEAAVVVGGGALVAVVADAAWVAMLYESSATSGWLSFSNSSL